MLNRNKYSNFLLQEFKFLGIDTADFTSNEALSKKVVDLFSYVAPTAPNQASIVLKDLETKAKESKVSKTS